MKDPRHQRRMYFHCKATGKPIQANEFATESSLNNAIATQLDQPNSRFNWWLAGVLLLLFWNYIGFAVAEPIPPAAMKYRADLTRAAHATWGLNAPIAVFAAQVHQESGWNPAAVSQVGAVGMTQFMPATASWMQQKFPELAIGTPQNPIWALRALVTYDKWLYDRVAGDSESDRLWAALRSYNGGLGHWRREAATVRPALSHTAVDRACGHALRTANYHPRSVAFCPENLGYPRRIMVVLQPRYLVWGRGVAT
jgi:soluble lytic murein transglycosylase-like protein